MFVCNAKRFAIASVFFPSRLCFWTDLQRFFTFVSWIVTQVACVHTWKNFIALTGKCTRNKCFINRILRVPELDKSCALKKIKMAGVSRHAYAVSHLREVYYICRTVNIFTITMPMAIKLGRVVTYHEWRPPIKSHDPLMTSSCEIMRQNKNISTTTVTLATKLGGMVTYLEGILVIRSYDPLITWLCEITWQTEIVIYPPPHCLEPPNWTGWWLALRSSYLESHIPLDWLGLARLCDSLKMLYLHYHSIYGHQTWQDDHLIYGS